MTDKQYFGENKNIEFKRQIPINHEKFLKDIIAFSNCEGGKVILGIEDETGEVCGIGDQSPFKLSDSISTMISDACTPQIEPYISIQTIEDKTVLIIDISPGKYRPYYLTNKGKENSTYIRINGTSRLADRTKLKELELEGQNISYDTLQEIGSEYDENKAIELCKTMKNVALNSCESEEEKLSIKDMTIDKLLDFGLLCKVGRKLYPTHAFNLMSDNTNKAAKIQCALFKGNTRDVFIDRKEFNGPIYEQVDEAYQFVLRHINVGAEINGEYRKDVYELPISAIREAIANAVLHRSYIDRSCIQICIFDDRIEVISPGALYAGLDIETIKSGKSACRNEAIAEAFHYMHIVEAWGTGIPRIINRCKEYGLPEPLFEEFGNGFKVTLFRKASSTSKKVSSSPEKVSSTSKKVSSTFEKVSSSPEKVSSTFEKYALLLEKDNVSNTFIHNIRIVYENYSDEEPFGQINVMNWLNCSKSKATNIMNVLKQTGIIEKVSGFGIGKYKFKDIQD